MLMIQAFRNHLQCYICKFTVLNNANTYHGYNALLIVLVSVLEMSEVKREVLLQE